MATFEIPDYNVPKLEEKIAKLNKKAVQLGVDPITIHVSGFKNVLLRDLYPGAIDQNNRPLYENSSECIRFAIVQVDGQAPKINGWQFLATIQPQYEEDGTTFVGNVLRIVPGMEGIPEKYRQATNWCDHCETNRVRNETYLVMSDAGETKQVGRTCLRDFLGHANPEKIAAWTTTLSDLCDLIGSYGHRGPMGGPYIQRYPLADFLTQCAAVIRVSGWVSRKFARISGKDATAAVAMEQLIAKHARLEQYIPIEEDEKLGKQTADWMEALELRSDNNDYLKNLSMVGQTGCVEYRTTGIAASGISAMKREFGESLIPERVKPAAANYLGSLKQRLVLDVTVSAVRAYSNDWGSGVVVKMVTPTGDVCTAFGLTGIVEGQSIKIKGTVKAHNEYKGQKETVLNRVVLM